MKRYSISNQSGLNTQKTTLTECCINGSGKGIMKVGMN